MIWLAVVSFSRWIGMGTLALVLAVGACTREHASLEPTIAEDPYAACVRLLVIGSHGVERCVPEPGPDEVHVCGVNVRRDATELRCTDRRLAGDLEGVEQLERLERTNRVAVQSLPKTKQIVGPRISLTFRRMNARSRPTSSSTPTLSSAVGLVQP